MNSRRAELTENNMDQRFANLVEQLAPKLERLMAAVPCRNGKLPADLPKSGIYLFSEGDRHLYVGRSNDLRGRYGRHCRPGATHRQAAFAFQLARERTSNLKRTYRTVGSRAWLMEQPDFQKAFTEAKAEIRNMDYRYVEESDQTRQALLEIYAAVVLSTKYNDFGTS
jgi:hypothetical protein